MKSKYDIARLHKDCLAWCENPTWKPWMVEDGWGIKEEHSQFSIFKGFYGSYTMVLPKYCSTYHKIIREFAHFIGLDVESYRLPEIDRDQAVRDYLAGIEEGAPLWEGSEWVKEHTKIIGDKFSIRAKNNGRAYWLQDSSGEIHPLAYTFLRLDLREDGK